MRLLENARQAEIGNSVRRKIGDVFAVQRNLATIAFEDAGDEIENRGLTGTVGADERRDFFRRNLKTAAVNGFDSAEIFFYFFQFKHYFWNISTLPFLTILGVGPAVRSPFTKLMTPEAPCQSFTFRIQSEILTPS